MSKFNIDIYSVAITTNIEDGKVYILSTQEDKIVFPFIEVISTKIESIDTDVIESMRRFLMTSSVELIPQIISVHTPTIKSRKKNTVNMVYGFLIKEGIKHFDSYWINFDYQQPNTEYANLIFEVIQKLK
jgi:hypothetical protein